MARSSYSFQKRQKELARKKKKEKKRLRKLEKKAESLEGNFEELLDEAGGNDSDESDEED